MGKISVDDLIRAARPDRDQELIGQSVPLLKRSWILRQQRLAAILTLPTIAAWLASIFWVIIHVRPLMLRNDWYGLLIILYLFCSMPIALAIIFGINRLFRLKCPYCGNTLYDQLGKSDSEAQQRCSNCQAIIIDLQS